MTDLSNRICVLCGRAPSTVSGEHALPRWLQRRLFTFPDEYTILRDGRELDRQNNIGGIQLPTCADCNALLRRRFEPEEDDPRIDSAVSFFLGDSDLVPARFSDWFRLWVVKTWLLLGHPEAAHTSGHYPRREDNPVDDRWFGWLLDPEVMPPDELSAWMHLDERMIDQRRDPPDVIVFPLVTVREGATTWRPYVSTMGVRRVQVDLVIQHGHKVVHPLAQSGEVLQLWPPVGELDVGSFPRVPNRQVSWIRGYTVTYQSADPQRQFLDLRHEMDMLELTGDGRALSVKSGG